MADESSSSPVNIIIEGKKVLRFFLFLIETPVIALYSDVGVDVKSDRIELF